MEGNVGSTPTDNKAMAEAFEDWGFSVGDATNYSIGSLAKT